jgi:tetratricopeptide (TPR) repeat protein
LQSENIISLLKNPAEITKKQTNSLQEILQVFPYFQAIQAIYLKDLKKQNSYLYNHALKKTAAYTTNRTVLFDFITSDVYQSFEEVKNSNEKLKQIQVIDSEFIEIDKRLKEVIKQKTLKKVEDAQEILNLGKPINFKKEEAFSFNQWLQLSNKVRTKINKKNDDLNEKKDKSKKIELIEKFLEKKPKIKPVKQTKTVDIAKDSVQYNTNLMTETLARVYVEQKKYNKAIQAFRILSLKYPEKSSFFAEQIKAVEFLKNN